MSKVKAVALRERELWAARENAELDVRIAERTGGDVNAAKEAARLAGSAWHDAYKDCAIAFSEIAEREGLTVEELRRMAQTRA